MSPQDRPIAHQPAAWKCLPHVLSCFEQEPAQARGSPTSGTLCHLLQLRLQGAALVCCQPKTVHVKVNPASTMHGSDYDHMNQHRDYCSSTCDAAAASKARSTTSVTRWLVSTLPPTTAASGVGARMDGAGMSILTGVKQPCRDNIRGGTASA